MLGVGVDGGWLGGWHYTRDMRCFVIQPFDGGGPFDKRYDDVLVPAIRDASLAAYRVDRDPSVSIPIDEIEDGIRNAEVCLADISQDNPNVWFEVGFAIASRKPLCLICDTKKDRFPFDVQHRSIIRYESDSLRDFTSMQDKITKKLVALVNDRADLSMIANSSPLSETDGLNPHEIALLAVTFLSDAKGDPTPTWSVFREMESAGFTEMATGVALHTLVSKNLIYKDSRVDERGEDFTVLLPTEDGKHWIISNPDKVSLRRKAADARSAHEPLTSDDIPF